MEGKIYKGIGGFYYVKTTGEGLLECKPRGIFRKQKIKPLPGDNVVLQSEAGTLYIDEILPRTNSFVRPAVANVQQFVLVASTVQPGPSFLVMDKLFAVAVDAQVQPLLVVTKGDIAAEDEIVEVYKNSGIPCICVNAANGQGLQQLKQQLKGKLSVLCGNSGVGKSTLLNALLPNANRETGEISQKLGRGRHTTREVELFEVAGGLVADTPGFASFDLQQAAPIDKENLQFAFPEIEKCIGRCKFTGCTHLVEKGCAVLQAVEAGDISAQRYNSYATLYKEAKEAQAY